MRQWCFPALSLLVCAMFGQLALAVELSFDERVDAETAIVQLQQSWRAGNDHRGVEPVPREQLERRVRTYLKQSVALKRFWDVNVDAQMLDAELQRIVRDTRDPDRLGRMFAALGDDPVLIRECIARPQIVSRTLRRLLDETGQSREAWWGTVEEKLDPHEVLAPSEPAPAIPEIRSGTSVCSPIEQWIPISTVSEPSDRTGHTVIWTGAEMVVWGGYSLGRLHTGGIYSPVFDSWEATSLVGAPPPRFGHTAVWSGSEMIVWGGDSGSTIHGARWSPVTNSWTPMNSQGGAVSGHSAVWAGDRMLVTGQGACGTGFGVSQYFPDIDSWTIGGSGSGRPTGRTEHTSVWSGSEMIVVGGRTSVYVGSSPCEYYAAGAGGRYLPSSDTWIPTAFFTSRAWHSAIWTGTEMLIWGGAGVALLGYPSGLRDDGVSYNPSSDLWAVLPTTDAPGPSYDHAAVWAGDEMVVLTRAAGAGRYNPSTAQWTPIPVGAPEIRQNSPDSAAWTGQAVIVWGGFSGGIYRFPRVDTDADDVCGSDDNCPDTPNLDQLDSDGDGAGDACDPCPAEPFDLDGDFYCAAIDNCLLVANPDQADSDGEGLGDVCDNCADTPNLDQLDSDGDGAGDACDVCSGVPDPLQNDDDGDGTGNLCEVCDRVFGVSPADDDADGLTDACEVCPAASTVSEVTSGSVYVWTFLVSPDGNRVVYVDIFDNLRSVSIFGGIATTIHDALATGVPVGDYYEISPDGTRVVYEADGLWSVPIDGGPRVRLDSALLAGDSFMPCSDPGLCWIISPNSQHVVFPAQVGASSHERLYGVSIEGGAVVILSQTPVGGLPESDVGSFDFDSVGTTVFFTADRITEDQSELWKVAVTGGVPSRINHPLAAQDDVFEFEITPDDTIAVYKAGTNGRDDLYAKAVSGGSALIISRPRVGGGGVQDFAISPDGSKVVYTGNFEQAGRKELYSVALDGSSDVRLSPSVAQTGYGVLEFAVSPTGSHVVYRADQDNFTAFELYSVPLGGGATSKLNLALIPGGEVDPEEFAISPDGSTVVHLADAIVDGRKELFATPIGGGAVTRLNYEPDSGEQVDRFAFASNAKVIFLLQGNPDWQLFVANPHSALVSRLSEPIAACGSGNVFDFAIVPGAQDVIYSATSASCGNELFGASIGPDTDGDLILDACDSDDGMNFLAVEDSALVSWQLEGSTPWSLYRGDLATLRAGGDYTQLPGSNPIAEQVCGLAVSFHLDSWLPDPGDSAFYLVAGAGNDLGTDSSGTPRPNANPCP